MGTSSDALPSPILPLILYHITIRLGTITSSLAFSKCMSTMENCQPWYRTMRIQCGPISLFTMKSKDLSLRSVSFKLSRTPKMWPPGKQLPIACKTFVLTYMPKLSPLKTSCSCSLCSLHLNARQKIFAQK